MRMRMRVVVVVVDVCMSLCLEWRFQLGGMLITKAPTVE